MGNKYNVYGWTYGDRLQRGIDEWYYAEIYRGQYLITALWKSFISRRHYGCVKLEMR